MKKFEINVPDGYNLIETFEINVPNGYKLVEIEKNKYEIRKEENTLPSTWEEYCEMYRVNSYYWFIDDISNITVAVKPLYERDRDPKKDRNLLSSKKQAEAFLALMQLVQLRDCYNKSEEATDECAILYDINDNTFDIWDASVDYTNHVLSFNSKHLAEQFLSNFRDLIEKARTLI